MRKDNKTNAILESHFNGWRDGYIGARMALIDATTKGLQKIPSVKQIENHYKKAEKEYTDTETTDENGNKTVSFRLMSFDFEKEVALCSAEIRQGLSNQTISFADFFACCNEFFK